MSESSQHIALVKAARKWVADMYFDGQQAMVLVHSAADPDSPRPPSISGHIPDIYAQRTDRSGEIIGEAKSILGLDKEREHTINQLCAFLRACGNSSNSVFVFAVPWHREPFARNLIRLVLQSDESLVANSIVVPGLPG